MFAGVVGAVDTPLGYEVINLGNGRPYQLKAFIQVREALHTIRVGMGGCVCVCVCVLTCVAAAAGGGVCGQAGRHRGRAGAARGCGSNLR